MKVVIASSSVPHVDGGANLLVRWTAEAMRASGHEVEEFFLPFPTGTSAALPALAAMRALPFAGSGDVLVTVRWPAHLIRHENKVAYFIHHHRILFDLWDTPYRDVRDDEEGRASRRVLQRMDGVGFDECRRIFTNSQIVSRRVEEFNGRRAEPLYPPLGGDVSRFRTGSYGDTIVYVSRVTPIKRQLLAVEAMRHTRTPVRLLIAGETYPPAYARTLRDLVAEHDLADRVELRTGWMSEDDKTAALADCLAVAYLPVDEDSYGYASLEASHSRKAIVTVTDAGGALEFVRDGVEGLVCSPSAVDLAAAFDRLYEDRAAAERMGQASFDRRADLGISWDTVVDRLLADGS